MRTTAAVPQRRTAVLRIAGGWAMLVCGLALFLVEILAVLASSRPYDVFRQAVSDLGVTACGPLDTYEPPVDVCSPLAGAVNWTWIVTGLLVAVAVVAVRPRRAGRIGRVAVGLVILAGLLQAAVGAVPVDSHLEAHIVLAFGGFLVQIVALPVFGAAMRREGASRVLVITSHLSGAAMLVGLLAVVLATVGLPGAPLGLAERLIIYPFQAWMIIMGVGVLRARG